MLVVYPIKNLYVSRVKIFYLLFGLFLLNSTLSSNSWAQPRPAKEIDTTTSQQISNNGYWLGLRAGRIAGAHFSKGNGFVSTIGLSALYQREGLCFGLHGLLPSESTTIDIKDRPAELLATYEEYGLKVGYSLSLARRFQISLLVAPSIGTRQVGFIRGGSPAKIKKTGFSLPIEFSTFFPLTKFFGLALTGFYTPSTVTETAPFNGVYLDFRFGRMP